MLWRTFSRFIYLSLTLSFKVDYLYLPFHTLHRTAVAPQFISALKFELKLFVLINNNKISRRRCIVLGACCMSEHRWLPKYAASWFSLEKFCAFTKHHCSLYLKLLVLEGDVWRRRISMRGDMQTTHQFGKFTCMQNQAKYTTAWICGWVCARTTETTYEDN